MTHSKIKLSANYSLTNHYIYIYIYSHIHTHTHTHTHTYIYIYIYEEELALNNLNGLAFQYWDDNRYAKNSSTNS